MSQYTFYFREHSIFSNWNTEHSFELFDQKFNCGEQAMMWSKAMIFGDKEKAEEIMQETDPREQKKKGKEVSGFDEDIWKGARTPLMYMIFKAKFSQNEEAYGPLIQSKNTIMVEASPYDKIWGCGLSEEKAKRTPESQWPGKNLHGKVMTKYKNDIFNNDVKDFSLDEILGFGIKNKQKVMAKKEKSQSYTP